MIEQIVGFKTAKLAQEKGFNIRSEPYRYHASGELTLLEGINAPRQSLLQAWIRNNHRIHIEIALIDSTTRYFWEFVITNSNERVYCEEDFTDEAKDIFYPNEHKTYEEALEAGLAEALKLIEDKK